jgi:hypothetical protein
MNVHSKSNDWREQILSNFAATPFSIQIGDTLFQCASVEGLWQGLKCEADVRLHVFGLSGKQAKKAGKGKEMPLIHIGGLSFEYGSAEHEAVIREAIKQKILQNKKAADALKGSVGTITHTVSSGATPIFQVENLLQSIRMELFGH